MHTISYIRLILISEYEELTELIDGNKKINESAYHFLTVQYTYNTYSTCIHISVDLFTYML